MKKAKNKKLNSVLKLILLLVVITGVSGLAYVACRSIGQGQSTEVEKKDTNTSATEENTEKSTTEATDQVDQTTDKADQAEPSTETKDENATNEEEVKDDTATSDTEKETVAETKKEGFFDRNKIKLGLDLQGGVNIVYEPQLEETLSDEELAASMQGAQALIQKRLDAKGYTEAEVSIEGAKRLRVDIPGVEDPQKAINEIGAAGMLYFYDQPILMEGQEVNTILTGKNIASARATQNSQNGEYSVAIQLDDEGTKLFSDYTAAHQGESIYIYLDNTLLSYPTLSAHITDGSGVITGNFTLEEAKELADGINAGSLPFTLEAISAQGVGAKLGMDALHSSLLAGTIGFIIIMVFMLGMYRMCGLAADIALILYVGLMILVLTMMNATLTLPGIAGILLSIGMAVDANVIIFARIREELEVGKSVRLAVDAGFSKAFKAIIDGNITTLIAASVLYFFGTGLIKSFATTLIVGIVISMFTALVVTRIALKAFVGMNINKPAQYAMLKKLEKEA